MTKDCPAPPALEYAMTVTLKITTARWVRPSQYGSERGCVFVTEGIVRGPNISGIVVPGSGGDYSLWRPDGILDFDGRYMLQTDDGANIYLQTRGYRWGSPEVMAKMNRREAVDDHSSYYFRTAPKFEAPAGKYDWLNKHVFIGRAEKHPEGNAIHYFKVS